MIGRIWRHEKPGEEPDGCLAHPDRTGAPDHRATDGNRVVYVFGRRGEDRANPLAVPYRGSMLKAEGFAGADREKAGYYPEDEQDLLGCGPKAGHNEVAVGPWGARRPGWCGRESRGLVF